MGQLMICPVCGKDRLLVAPYYSSEGNAMMCPICALTARNKLHGLPANTPFRGSTAQGAHDRELIHEEKTNGLS